MCQREKKENKISPPVCVAVPWSTPLRSSRLCTSWFIHINAIIHTPEAGFLKRHLKQAWRDGHMSIELHSSFVDTQLAWSYTGLDRLFQVCIQQDRAATAWS
jgi:hypothetical protein